MMKYLVWLVFLLCAGVHSAAQTDLYLQELQNLADISRLPLYPAGEIEQISSYDRTGGNDDGFSGKYSFIREEAGGLVIAELKGPGVINRIWTPTPSAEQIEFYFDGEKTPRISIPFIDLFTGKSHPFVPPLCGNEVGGYYCYLPLPYEKSLKIVLKGKNIRFFQIQYRSLSEKEKMRSFSLSMADDYKEVLKKTGDLWSRQISPLDSYGTGLKAKKISLRLQPGIEATIFELGKGGRIVGIEMGAGSDLLQAYRKVMLSARWDQEAEKALDLPLHDFFGFAFGKPSMQSLLLGSDQSKFYSYLPMPFDHTAEIQLRYDRLAANDPEELIISGTIYYSENGRDKNAEGKLYAQSGRVYNGENALPHTIADISGKGHFIGTILTAQGLEDGHTRFFEGDDIATIDGEMKLHGTGSEDYFNGGYYAVLDKWDAGFSLPIHGSLLYDQMTSRTGGYRFYLSDKLNFDTSFKLTIEHQPDDTEKVKTDYTSIGLFYAEKPQFESTEIRIDDRVPKISHTDKLSPRGMSFTLYWNATADFQDPAIVFGLNKSDEWYATIDMEAIPIVQLSLAGLDPGRYRLYIEFEETGHGKPFSIWQRSKQVSGWIPTETEIPTGESKTVYAGEIEITEELHTITLRKKLEDDASLRIHTFLFEKTE